MIHFLVVDVSVHELSQINFSLDESLVDLLCTILSLFCLLIEQSKNSLLVHWCWETVVLYLHEIVLVLHQLILLVQFFILVKHRVELLSFCEILLILVVEFLNQTSQNLSKTLDFCVIHVQFLSLVFHTQVLHQFILRAL